MRLERLGQVGIVLVALILLQLKEWLHSLELLRQVMRRSRLCLQIRRILLRSSGFGHLVDTRGLVLNICLFFFRCLL